MKAELKNEVFNALKEQGLFNYGEAISRCDLLKLFGVEILNEHDAEHMTFNDIRTHLESENLKELAIVDFIRNALLKDGKYFSRNKSQYRVALPSENAQMADNYMKSASRKIRKARILLKSTPQDALLESGNIASRLLIAERQVARKVIQ